MANDGKTSNVPTGQNGTSTSQTNGEKKRYSDDELLEFKEMIIQKLETAKVDYEMYRSAISGAGTNGTNDTSPTFKVLEEGAATLSKEEAGKLAQRQFKFINSLQSALIRCENRTYGICRETGKLIPRERLKANLVTTVGIDTPEKRKEGISPLAMSKFN